MKELKEYDRYIVPGLLIVLIILVVWSTISKSNVGRYQFWCNSDNLIVTILDTKTSHIWIRVMLGTGSEGNRLLDFGTIEKPLSKPTPAQPAGGIFSDILEKVDK
jgi:hypothetical protein